MILHGGKIRDEPDIEYGVIPYKYAAPTALRFTRASSQSIRRGFRSRGRGKLPGRDASGLQSAGECLLGTDTHR